MYVLIRCLLALAFVPVLDIPLVFDTLCDEFPKRGSLQEKCDELLAYFNENYVRGTRLPSQRGNPLFSMDTWNHFTSAINRDPKTTNHNALNKMFTCAHPGIWKLFKGIRRDVGIHRGAIIKGDVLVPGRKRRKYVKLAHRLSKKASAYDLTQNKMTYLKSVARISYCS